MKTLKNPSYLAIHKNPLWPHGYTTLT